LDEKRYQAASFRDGKVLSVQGFRAAGEALGTVGHGE
jgi:hypothetical protein